VINYVRPDAIAIELCESRAKELMERISKDDNLYTLYRKSRRAQGGRSTKVGLFIRNYLQLLRGEVIPANNEFRVAMENASRMGAGCFFIDQNFDLMNQKLVNLVKSSDSIRQSFERVLEAYRQKNKDTVLYATRSSAQELNRFWKDVSPETFRILVEDRDKHMFKELRRLQGIIVAIVGMAHMEGIELLWKHAEN
ncbi:hypothetical protein MKW94_029381, partial [Papaver nudicaule]|nr:hypothetical protein [Papaver nudicaule]